MADDSVNDCLQGNQLYGDDFTGARLHAWFAAEAEGYARLGAEHRDVYRYGYHALNRYHGFRWLPAQRRFPEALGLGSAYGDEFLPIIDRIDRITIVDPSEAFATRSVRGVPLSRVPAKASGDLPFESTSFDLVLGFGVLHHIANVSHVVREIGRCTKPGGFYLLREPVSSMGDWRTPRPGLTKNERGIPRKLLSPLLQEAGFDLLHRAPCHFAPVAALGRRLGVWPYDRPAGVRLDAVLSRWFAWNNRYHRVTLGQKLAPSAMAYVCLKRGSEPRE